MELNTNNTNTIFKKKITAYLDGSLSSEDKSEFEAYVRTHPEFEAEINKKNEELAALQAMMPAATLSRQDLESLEGEMKQSIFNLLKEEPKNVMDRVKNSWEEWINR